MNRSIAGIVLAFGLAVVLGSSVMAAGKPLKVYILAGQSNMEGWADVSTFDYIGLDPKTAPLLKEMRNPDGTSRVCENVWISYLTGWTTFGEGFGKLTTGYGGRPNDPTRDGGKIGPEFTFGIYMQKLVNQPILLIKFAVGGKSLNTDYRSPSAGPYQFSKKQLARHGNNIEKVKADKYSEIINTAHKLNKDGSIVKDSPLEIFWKPLGTPKPEDRDWRFTSIDPQQEKDKLREYTQRRFREITFPAGMEQWYMPDFDDSKWNLGKVLIGKGVWKQSGITVNNHRSAWGEGEFLLMRTKFEVAALDCVSYRLSLLARQGVDVYLNGHKIHSYSWWQDKPYYRSIVLGDAETQYLKKGGNILAAYANDQYNKDSTEHYATIDLCIEGLTQSDKDKLDRSLEELYPLQDRATIKGCSHWHCHYMGSAKIVAQIGKAFAEATNSLKPPDALVADKTYPKIQ